METSLPTNAAGRNQARFPWPAQWRFAASVLVALHISAVFVGPFSFGTRDVTSPLAISLGRTFRPYLEVVATQYQGYQFFNEPGPSHLIRYELEFDDGRETVRGTFPDIKEHWPRLRYHRHFMLTEHAFTQVVRVEPTPPPGVEPGTPNYEFWRKLRTANEELSRAILASYAQHLMYVHGAARARLFGIERRYPMPEEVVAGVKLGDPRFVSEEFLGTFEAEEDDSP